MGVHDKEYVARIWLYFFFGVLDAMWQITAYWIMGAMSNDPAKLAYFSGLCRFLFFFIGLTAGPNLFFLQTNRFSPQVLLGSGERMVKRYRQWTHSFALFLTMHFPRYLNIFISTWVLLVAGLVFGFPMIYLRVKDTTTLADETM
jgi:hypothetical protein